MLDFHLMIRKHARILYDEDSGRGTHWAMRAVRDDSIRPGRSPPGSAWCANNGFLRRDHH